MPTPSRTGGVTEIGARGDGARDDSGQALRAEQLELQTLRIADDESGATAYFSFGLARSLLEVSLRDGHVQAAQVVD